MITFRIRNLLALIALSFAAGWFFFSKSDKDMPIGERLLKTAIMAQDSGYTKYVVVGTFETIPPMPLDGMTFTQEQQDLSLITHYYFREKIVLTLILQ